MWHVSGNIDEKETISMVEEARKQLNLKESKIEDLTKIRTIMLEEGKSYLMELPLTDKSNENSCNLTYFEVGYKSQ